MPDQIPRFATFRDHEHNGWGVSDSAITGTIYGAPIAFGMNRSIATALAALLNGDMERALEMAASGKWRPSDGD